MTQLQIIQDNSEEETLFFIREFFKSDLLKATDAYYEVRNEFLEATNKASNRLALSSSVFFFIVTMIVFSSFLSGFALGTTLFLVNMASICTIFEGLYKRLVHSKVAQGIFGFCGRNLFEKFNYLKDKLKINKDNLLSEIDKNETRVMMAKLFHLFTHNNLNNAIRDDLEGIMKNYMDNDIDKVFQNFTSISEEMRSILKDNFELKNYIKNILTENAAVTDRVMKIYKKKNTYKL